MKCFKDEKDRNWELTINIATVKKIMGLLDVNLLELEKGDPPLLTRLGTDLMLLVDVIYVLCKTQADARNVTDEDFGLALNGEAICRAQEAFYEELVLFFRGLGRSDLAQAIQTQLEMIKKAVAVMQQKIESVDVDEVLQNAFGKEFTNLLESSESSPTPSPSEN